MAVKSSLRYLMLSLLLTFMFVLHAREKKDNNNASLTYFIQKEKSFGSDTIALREFLTPLRQRVLKGDANKQTAVYYALMGRGTSRKIGQINTISSTYFEKANDLAIKFDDEALALWVQIELAKYFYQFNLLEQSLPYFMTASFKIDDIPYVDQINPDESYRSLGFFFSTIGEYKEAINCLKEAAFLAPDLSEMKASILDNLAMCHLEDKDTSVAMAYLNDAKELALKIDAKARLARVNGMLAMVSLGRGELDSALHFVDQDVKLSEESGDKANRQHAEIIKAKVLMGKGDMQSAEVLLEHLKKDLKGNLTKTDFLLDVEELRLKIAEHKGDPDMELAIRRSLGQLKDSSIYGESAVVIQRARVLAAKERYLNEASIINLKVQQSRFARNMYLLVLALGIGIVIISYIDFRRKMFARHHRYEKKVLAYRLEKTLLDQKLEQAHRTLADHLRFLTDRNKQIESLQREIARINKSALAEIEEKNGKLKQLLQSHILTEDDWQNFKMTFDEAYPNYYNQLKKGIPELTENNIRFIMLQKLGLTPAETANILGISLEAIKKNKQRLKQKLGDKYDRVMEII